MRETASGRRQAPLNVTSSLDAARELGIRDAQALGESIGGSGRCRRSSGPHHPSSRGECRSSRTGQAEVSVDRIDLTTYIEYKQLTA